MDLKGTHVLVVGLVFGTFLHQPIRRGGRTFEREKNPALHDTQAQGLMTVEQGQFGSVEVDSQDVDGPGMLEREVKYQVLDQALFRRLNAMDHIGNFALEHAGTVDILTIYLDTPELNLFYSHHALRLRNMQGTMTVEQG